MKLKTFFKKRKAWQKGAILGAAWGALSIKIDTLLNLLGGIIVLKLLGFKTTMDIPDFDLWVLFVRLTVLASILVGILLGGISGAIIDYLPKKIEVTERGTFKQQVKEFFKPTRQKGWMFFIIFMVANTQYIGYFSLIPNPVFYPLLLGPVSSLIGWFLIRDPLMGPLHLLDYINDGIILLLTLFYWYLLACVLCWVYGAIHRKWREYHS